MHASAGRAEPAALLVAAAALLVATATSLEAAAAGSGVLDAVLVGVPVGLAALCAVVAPDVDDEHPTTPRTSAAAIAWRTLNLLFMTASPSSRTGDRPR